MGLIIDTSYLLKKEFEQFFTQTSLCSVIDHSGRGGNAFVLSIFDNHPEVLCCPWIHYTYSYFLTEFGNEDQVDSKRAHKHWTESSYFRLVYQDVNQETSSIIKKFGADPESEIDRDLLRSTFDTLVLNSQSITRKELILASFFAYAKGVGRDIMQTKYCMVSDAVSLRTESSLTGFAGTAIDLMVSDFSDAKLVSLVRDPRATWASSRHQFVNQNGNMYGVTPANFFSKLADLLQLKLKTDGCAWLYWSCYNASALSLIFRKKQQYHALFGTLKNEDLNLSFVPTMEAFADWLSISYLKEWVEDYAPTMVGKLWRGTGAYNNSYQPIKDGLLKNDSEEVSRNSAGPNRHVTERWKKRLASHEISMLEVLFRSEIEDMEYPILQKSLHRYFPLSLFYPFKGEVPKLSWLTSPSRWAYVLTLPIFYLFARIVFLRVVYLDRLFDFGELRTVNRIKATNDSSPRD